MVEAEQVQDRGVQVVNVDFVLDGRKAEVVGCAVETLQLRERLKSPVVRTSTRAVELHAALHEIENQRATAATFVR